MSSIRSTVAMVAMVVMVAMAAMVTRVESGFGVRVVGVAYSRQ